MAITKVHARTIYDSRGNPTVECEVHDENGTHVAQVPSGASTGALEAHELRDGDKSKWGGKGVTKAVNNVNSILGPELIKSGLRVTDQTAVDELLNKLDGTDNKSKLGANAILALSMAVCEAGAKSKGVPLYSHLADLAGTSHSSYVLPVPMLNIINGGSHAGGTFAFQECMICPDGATSFAEAMRMGSETYQVLKSLTKKRYGAIAGNVGDEGGFAPELKTADEALDLIMAAIKGAGYEGKISIAMDVAASEFYTAGEEKPYDLDFKADSSVEHRKINYEELAEIYKELMKKYPIVSIEDGFAEDDFEAWSYFYKSAKGIQLVGDDLTVSNVKLVQKAQDAQACNGLLLKVNQIGSITEAIKAAKMSYGFDWGVMTSHRSGETSSTFIADLAVGIRCGQIKSGAPCRSERLGKYNRLLAIEEELGDKAVYAGKKFRAAVKI